jgi:hypothetical protein
MLANPVVDLAADVAANVEAQVGVYRRLELLSKAQFEALRGRDVHAVHETLQEIETVMLDRARLEARRGELVALVAHRLSVAPEDVTASLLADRCGAHDVAPRLLAASDELRTVVFELDKVVHANRALLEHEIDAVDRMVKVVTVDRTVQPRYQRSGAQAVPSRIKLLDAQV